MCRMCCETGLNNAHTALLCDTLAACWTLQLLHWFHISALAGMQCCSFLRLLNLVCVRLHHHMHVAVVLACMMHENMFKLHFLKPENLMVLQDETVTTSYTAKLILAGRKYAGAGDYV